MKCDMDNELRKQSNSNSTFFCKSIKTYLDYEWDCSYPLIEPTETNEHILLNDDRFWGKI